MLGLVSVWVRWETKVGDSPHHALCHLDRVLETGIASWLQFMPFRDRSQNVWRVSWKFKAIMSISGPSEKADGRNYSQTRHFANPLPNSRSHAHDPDLAERVLVETFVHELARVLEAEVEPGRAHVSVHH
jgi:hypothetical protein